MALCSIPNCAFCVFLGVSLFHKSKLFYFAQNVRYPGLRFLLFVLGVNFFHTPQKGCVKKLKYSPTAEELQLYQDFCGIVENMCREVVRSKLATPPKAEPAKPENQQQSNTIPVTPGML